MKEGYSLLLGYIFKYSIVAQRIFLHLERTQLVAITAFPLT